MDDERLQLGYADRARYFAPVAFCGFIASICAALIVTSLFLTHLPDAVALTAAGGFGFTLATGLGATFLWVQLHELRYLTVQTQSDAHANFDWAIPSSGVVTASNIASGLGARCCKRR